MAKFVKKTGQKVCNGCGENDINKFTKCKRGYMGLKSQCRVCEGARAKAWKEKNKDKHSDVSRKWRVDNPKYGKEWRDSNPDLCSEYRKDWEIMNPDKIKLKYIKRRWCLLISTPKDVDISEIKAKYSYAADQGLEVDHIIPLQGLLPDGRRILGVHKMSNLQLLTPYENSSKGNKVAYKDLDGVTEGIDYIFVPNDYFETIKDNKYPEIGFDAI